MPFANRYWFDDGWYLLFAGADQPRRTALDSPVWAWHVVPGPRCHRAASRYQLWRCTSSRRPMVSGSRVAVKSSSWSRTASRREWSRRRGRVRGRGAAGLVRVVGEQADDAPRGRFVQACPAPSVCLVELVPGQVQDLAGKTGRGVHPVAGLAFVGVDGDQAARGEVVDDVLDGADGRPAQRTVEHDHVGGSPRQRRISVGVPGRARRRARPRVRRAVRWLSRERFRTTCVCWGSSRRRVVWAAAAV